MKTSTLLALFAVMMVSSCSSLVNKSNSVKRNLASSRVVLDEVAVQNKLDRSKRLNGTIVNNILGFIKSKKGKSFRVHKIMAVDTQSDNDCTRIDGQKANEYTDNFISCLSSFTATTSSGKSCNIVQVNIYYKNGTTYRLYGSGKSDKYILSECTQQ